MTGSLAAWALAFLLLPPRPALELPRSSAMARHIAEGFTTVPWAPGGDLGALDLAANLSALAFPDDRTVWDEFCARHGLSDNAARMLRLVGRDTLVEFAVGLGWAGVFRPVHTAVASWVPLAGRPALGRLP